MRINLILNDIFFHVMLIRISINEKLELAGSIVGLPQIY